jgi:hypothetical protein
MYPWANNTTGAAWLLAGPLLLLLLLLLMAGAVRRFAAAAAAVGDGGVGSTKVPTSFSPCWFLNSKVVSLMLAAVVVRYRPGLTNL